MKVTGERFIPKMMCYEAEIEHYHRYTSIKELVKGKVVLDAACGTGYGSKMLSESALEVYAIDISNEAVSYAKENYNSHNIIYQQSSIHTLPFSDNFFDAIICFETIEHVDEVMQKAFLKEAKRVLKSDGILIMSTPNKKTFTDDRGMLTKYHIHEFYEDEFNEFIHAQFPYCKLYHQYYAKTSHIISYEGKSIKPYGFDQLRRGFFFIAVASMQPIPDSVDLNSCYYYPDKYEKANESIQIYYSVGGVFSEDNRYDAYICKKPGVISESINLHGIVTDKIRIDPLSSSCEIEIDNIIITYSDLTTESITEYETNADKKVNNTLLFLHSDPQVLINFKEEKKLFNVSVQFKIIRHDIDIYIDYQDLKINYEHIKMINQALKDSVEQERKKRLELENDYNLLIKNNELIQQALSQEKEKILQYEKMYIDLVQQMNNLKNEIVQQTSNLNTVVQQMNNLSMEIRERTFTKRIKKVVRKLRGK